MAHKKVERMKELDRRRHRREQRLKERIHEAQAAAKTAKKKAARKYGWGENGSEFRPAFVFRPPRTRVTAAFPSTEVRRLSSVFSRAVPKL